MPKTAGGFFSACRFLTAPFPIQNVLLFHTDNIQKQTHLEKNNHEIFTEETRCALSGFGARFSQLGRMLQKQIG